MMSDEFCQNELKRVYQDWQNGEQIIQWKTVVSYGKIFQYIYKMIVCFIFFLFAYKIIQNFNEKNNIISILLLFCIFNLFVIIFDTVHIESIKINRKKQWIYSTYYIGILCVSFYAKPFHATGYFLPFRLPENDTGEYAQLREKLQATITRETGIRFYKSFLID